MKRALIIVGILLLVVPPALWKLSGSRRYQVFGELVARAPRVDSVVALTFDDGPTPGYTDTVLALLRDRGVKATFFVTGRETEANLEEARRLVAEGHELGNHSYSHSRMVLMGPATIREEIDRTDQAIREAGHAGAIYFRPPYGKKLVTLPWHLAQTGRTTIMWDLEPDSHAEIAGEASRIVDHVVANARPGSIILLHVMYESRSESMKAVPGIIDGLRARGYTFVTITELLQPGRSAGIVSSLPEAAASRSLP